MAAGLLAYHNSFTGPFIFDDVPKIPENPSIRHLWPPWSIVGHNSRPVLLWMADSVAWKKRMPAWKTSYRLLSTDATPALARGYKAMSVMAIDDDGRLPNWHWQSDTADNVNMENLELARAFLWNLAKRIETT